MSAAGEIFAGPETSVQKSCLARFQVRLTFKQTKQTINIAVRDHLLSRLNATGHFYQVLMPGEVKDPIE